ncbi:MAG: hypothetical protein VKP62_03655 [Candidatus Sericytochromatia bacterium]|nr:hypothetical protein [Candidatus Sericytochromatia bacterium]
MKPMLLMGPSWAWPAVCLMLGLAMLSVFWWRRRRWLAGRSLPHDSVGPVFQRTSDALAGLRRAAKAGEISAEGLHQNLSDILRAHLHQQWKLPAQALTSPELLHHWGQTTAPEGARPLLAQILVNTDTARFSPSEALVPEGLHTLGQAERFLELTGDGWLRSLDVPLAAGGAKADERRPA